jgi:N-acetyl-anhydromuramyl-L-alanine amidase AmpD
MILEGLRSGGMRDAVDIIVVHSMGEFVKAGEMPAVHAHAMLKELGLSAHYLVTPSGDVASCVPEAEVAWHCKGVNRRSIGIEVLVAGCWDWNGFVERIKSPDAFSDEQILATSDLVKGLMRRYGVVPSNVRRHADLSDTKPDPGSGFPWGAFKQIISEKEE